MLLEILRPSLVNLACKTKIVRHVVLKVVWINEIIASVVGGINVYKFHLSGIGFLEELQDLEVVALNH